MKFKALAIGMVAAQFTFTSLAQSQQAGYGLYGGSAPCGYANGPAPGATSQNDELAILIQQRRDLEAEHRQLVKDLTSKRRGDEGIEEQMRQERENFEKYFKPVFSEAFLKHIDLEMNCNLCGGDDGGTAPIQPRPNPNPPPIDPGQGGKDGPPTDPGQTAPVPAPVTVTPIKPPVVTAPPPRDPPVRPPVVAKPPKGIPEKPKSDEETAKELLDSAGGKFRDCSQAVGETKFFKGMNPAQQRAWCKKQGYQALNDSSVQLGSGNRMPASTGFSETGGSSGAPRQAAVPVRTEIGGNDFDFDTKTNYPSPEGEARGGGPASCYNLSESKLYGSKAWLPPRGACRSHGQINPDVCRTRGYLNDGDGRDAYKCESSLKKYQKLHKEYEDKQREIEANEQELDEVKDAIKELRNDHSRSADDSILEAAASKKAQSGGGGRNGPSFGQSLLSVGLGAAAGVGTYALINGSQKSAWRENNQALTSLGWQTLPYQSNGQALAAGMGMFQGVTGGLLGSFGCGQMNGGVSAGLFGNPYGGSGFGQMGGGMYNGAGPWGQAGPWGNQGLGAGGGFVGGMVGGYAGAPYAGGYAGVPYAGGYAGAPYAGGYAGVPYAGGYAGGAPYVGGVVGGVVGAPYSGGYAGVPYAGGYAGGVPYAGGYAGYAGGVPYQGGYAGGAYIGGIAGGIVGGQYSGGYAGMGGGYLGSYAGGYQGSTYAGGYVGGAQYAQIMQEQQARAYTNYQATTMQASTLQQRMAEIQAQLYQLNSYGSSGSSYNFPSSNSYPYQYGTTSPIGFGTTTTPTVIPAQSR